MRGERVLDHCRGGVQKVLSSAVAETIVVSIISTAGELEGGKMGWCGGVDCVGVGAPVGRCLRWQAAVARVAGSVRQSSERGRVV